MRRMITLGMTVAALAATAAPARAGDLMLEAYEDDFGGSSYRVAYTAAAGETNQVTASYDARTATFTLTDAGVSSVQPRGVVLLSLDTDRFVKCRYQSNRVTCTGISKADHNALDFDFDLGDGSDTASFASGHGGVTMTGGAGDDALTQSGSASATFRGGDGNDTLEKTGGGHAFLYGETGDDVLVSGAGGSYQYGGRGADAFNGGTGFDRIEFPWTGSNPSPDGHTGVSVSFDGVANDGMPGEGDNVSDAIEAVFGTTYADTMTGDERPQHLDGYTGDDVLDGAAGDDVLIGHGGSDRLTGGLGVDWLHGDDTYASNYATGGNDVIDARDGTFDRFTCNKGTDMVLADAMDAFEYPSGSADPAECETVDRSA